MTTPPAKSRRLLGKRMRHPATLAAEGSVRAVELFLSRTVQVLRWGLPPATSYLKLLKSRTRDASSDLSFQAFKRAVLTKYISRTSGRSDTSRDNNVPIKERRCAAIPLPA